jgi:hypothetical protein
MGFSFDAADEHCKTMEDYLSSETLSNQCKVQNENFKLQNGVTGASLCIFPSILTFAFCTLHFAITFH